MLPLCWIRVSVVAVLSVCVPRASAAKWNLELGNSTKGWQTVVDGVMGGLTTGRSAAGEGGTRRLTGELSLEHTGGVSQSRTAVSEGRARRRRRARARDPRQPRRRAARPALPGVLSPPPLQALCIRHEPPGLCPADLDRHTVTWLERLNASGSVWLTPAQLEGRWMVRISIGSLPTERTHRAQFLTDLQLAVR